jgi:hypothetical protein
VKLRPTPIVLAAMAVLSAASCSSSSSSDQNAPATGPVGGAVVGPADDHCAGQPEGVADPAACSTPASPTTASTDNGDESGGAAGETAPSSDAGAADCTLTHDASYGDTLYNSSGDDDDCKYQVSWTSTAVRKGESVTFTVTATSIATGAPLEALASQPPGSNALSRLELYIPCQPTHVPPAGDFQPTIKEIAPGVYTAGPIVFDESGRWVVRFHFYEECLDQDNSPHGHAAFFVEVP